MPVVINDFEVVNESAQGTPRASGAAEEQGETRGGGNTPAAPTPNDIRRMMRRQLERIDRISAD